MPTLNFNPHKDIPDLSGKVIVVTGGTAGLGAQSVIQFARKNPRAIYFTGRNAIAAAKVIECIKAENREAVVEFIHCDQASLVSIEQTARKILTEVDRLDILMCNAGIMAKPPELTVDGYELQFGTNHLAHALLIRMLLPLLEQTSKDSSDVRVVLLSSLAFRAHPPDGIAFKGLKTVQDFGSFGAMTRYGQSKLANLLYARELAQRYPHITTLAIHPGVVSTDLVGNLALAARMFVYAITLGRMLTPEEGAYNQLWAACGDKSNMRNGQMYEPVGIPCKLDKAAEDRGLGERLWEWTENELRGFISHI